jgi:hypothetical protein
MLIDNEMYWCHCGTGFGDEKDFAYHYADCNKYDQDWLTKANLIQKPVRCSECGDSGEISKIVSVGFLVNKCTDPCECRDNPQSYYNFKVRMEG